MATVVKENEPRVSAARIAAHFDVHPGTVARWRREGMPAAEIGGLQRYRLSEVEAWLRNRKQKETSSTASFKP
jgi:phage terminase Nu1 subunit (DNA packaging protein)